MIVDPVALMATKSLLIPTSTSHPSHTALPTVVPDMPEYQKATQSGMRTLWVVFVLMVLSSAAFAGLSWRIPITRRLFHVLTTLITIIAAISYFAMATGHGVSYNKITVVEEHDHVPDTTHTIFRQVYYARYIDWALTTPLLLLDLSFLAGLNGAHIMMAIAADVIMILTGLFAAFGSEGTPQKWGWYTIACIAYLVVVWHLALHGRAMAFGKGDKVGKFFGAIAGFTLVIWTAYPIIWGIADGGRHLGVNGEIIAYAILDILAKPVFGLWLLLTHKKLPETNVELGGFWAHGLNSEGRLRVGDDDDGA